MAVELWQNPSFLDVVRLRLHIREGGVLTDPQRINSFSIWQQGTRILDLGPNPWAPEGGPIIRESVGQFYYDFNPYRHRIQQPGHYFFEWSAVLNSGPTRGRSNFYLKEADTRDLPKETYQEIFETDGVRLRFTITDSGGTPIDPELINRLVVYQAPFGRGQVEIESRAVFSLFSSQNIWTRSGFLSGEKSPLKREGTGDFYYDWNLRDSPVAPGRLIACLYYRLPDPHTVLRGNSYQVMGQEFFVSPGPAVAKGSQGEFEKMYQTWFPRYLLEQPPAGNQPAVAPRILKAYGNAAKELFDYGEGFTHLFDPERVDSRALFSLASNLGVIPRGRRPAGWRNQIKEAVNLYLKKGTLEGLRDYIGVAGGKLESLIKYWQVLPRGTWRDYWVINPPMLKTYQLVTSKQPYLNPDESNPYKFITLHRRRVKARGSPPHRSLTVVSGSENVRGVGTQFVTWGIQGGDMIKIILPNGKSFWNTVASVLDETRLVLSQPHPGKTSSGADFLVSESSYLQLDPQTHLLLETTGVKISSLRWNILSGGELATGDEILLQYQTRIMTPAEEEIEREILSLPLADSREERYVSYPPKNFNARLLEDPDGLWYSEEPERKYVSNERLAGPIGSFEKFLANHPLSHLNLQRTPGDYLFVPPDKRIVSLYGSFTKDSTLYKFAVSGSGGLVGENSWIHPAGSGVSSITLTDRGIIFKQPGFIENAWVYYTWIRGQFSPKDRTYLRTKRDRLCPLGIKDSDLVTFGYHRTVFPYSEKVYNMDEYNGSLRPSKDPCHIDPTFVDECDCSPTTLIDLSVRLPELSEDSIKEFREIIKEAKPFHAPIRNISFVGDMSDALIFQEAQEVSLSISMEDTFGWVRSHFPKRGESMAGDRGELFYLKHLSSGPGELVDPTITFYSGSSDFITAPANPHGGLLLITEGNPGEYSFTDPQLHTLKIVGLESAPSTNPQRFSLFNPLGSAAGILSRHESLLGSTLYGVSPYASVMLTGEASRARGGTQISVRGVDLIELLGLRVGDYLRRSTHQEFLRIIRFEKDNSGKHSVAVVEEKINSAGPLTFWRRAIADGIGYFQETYNTIQGENLPAELAPDSSYLVSISSPVQERGEYLSGPLEDGKRHPTFNGPVVFDDLFGDTSGYVGPLPPPYSAHGSFSVGSKTFYFVLKGSGGLVGDPDCDIFSPESLPSGISSIQLEEKGLTFRYLPSAPPAEELKLWYHWRSGSFHPVASLVGDKLTAVGLSELSGGPCEYHLYEIIPTGIMFNPGRYSGSLKPPYSAYGSFEKGGITYYFVTKDEGGQVGISSGISPGGSGVISIYRRGKGVDIQPSAGVTLKAVELAPFSTREELEESLVVKITPEAPYFINVRDQTLEETSYRKIPPAPSVDRSELGLKEVLSVTIDNGGIITEKVLAKG